MTARRTVAGRPPAVQPESRLRLSGELDARTVSLVHHAHVAASQKRALHATIHGSTRSVGAIAAHAGISYQFLSNAALDCAKEQLPFARLGLVLEVCSDLTFLRLLADLQHADVLARPQLAGAAVGDRQTATAIREFAQFIDAGAGASDGDLSPARFADIEREGLEAIEAIRLFLAVHRARVRRPLLEGM